MIAGVVDTTDEPEHVAWLNGLHDPGSGLLVAHVPPRCEARTLAREVLHALGRTPESGAVKIAEAHTWVSAWLATAVPRADLVLYGTHRLEPSAIALCEALGRLPTVNVWLVTNQRDTLAEQPWSSAVAHWPWSLFASQPSLVRDSSHSVALELDGAEAPADWDPTGLPPFPFSHAKARLLGPQSRQAVTRLGLAYDGARAEIKPLLPSPSGSARRNLAGAVARLALISTCRPDISVLCRYLEHDVFLHNGLLHVDVDRVAEILSSDNPFHARTRPRHRTVTDGLAHSDPERAGRLVLSLPADPWGRRHHSGEVDVAADGTHFIREDGVQVNVPPWGRWPLRALVWQRSHLGDTAAQRFERRFSTDQLYRNIRPLAPPVIGRMRMRNGLEPLTSMLTEAITYATQTGEPGQTAGLMPQEAATAIWTTRRPDNASSAALPNFHDPGVRWLAKHGLLLEGPWSSPILQPWLERAVGAARVLST